ncbi:MAG: FAD-dependent oxidoreductase [Acidobacteriota bacterium]
MPSWESVEDERANNGEYRSRNGLDTMRQTDILIIGGNVAGSAASITTRHHYPHKETLLVRSEMKAAIPCGIPYIFGTLGSVDKDLRPDAMLEKAGVKFAFERVEAIDLARRRVQTSVGEIGYERLIVATGSVPARVPIPGIEKDGVFPVSKDVAHLDALLQRLHKATQVVVIGGGFIGIEFADEIQKLGNKTVTILEIAPHCLSLAYDEEFCVEMENTLQAHGVHIRTGVKAVEILGDGRVEAVRLEDGAKIPAEVVILAVGAVPNVELAKAAGLKLGPTGAVAVDRTMQTSHAYVFACGDCAEKISFFGGRPSTLRLATIGAMEARIAGANLYGIRREHIGTVGVSATSAGSFVLAVAGLTEMAAKQNGYDAVAGAVEGPNRHPGVMPGSVPTKLKLVFDRRSGILLGGQARGSESVGEMINIVAACIQQRMTADQIAIFQMSTQPTLTASPGTYPLVNAAEQAIAKMAKS